ncbi:MAG: hypothetical protein WC184_01365 [Acidimicrobiia bacterium]
MIEFEPASSVYRIEQLKAPRRKRFWSWVGTLVTAGAMQDMGTVMPILKRYRIVEIRDNATIIDLDETAFDRLDLGTLLREDLENLSPEDFIRRWVLNRQSD